MDLSVNVLGSSQPRRFPMAMPAEAPIATSLLVKKSDMPQKQVHIRFATAKGDNSSAFAVGCDTAFFGHSFVPFLCILRKTASDRPHVEGVAGALDWKQPRNSWSLPDISRQSFQHVPFPCALMSQVCPAPHHDKRSLLSSPRSASSANCRS